MKCLMHSMRDLGKRVLSFYCATLVLPFQNYKFVGRLILFEPSHFGCSDSIHFELAWKIPSWRLLEVSAMTTILRSVWWKENVQESAMSDGFKTMNIPATSWVESCCTTRSNHLTISDKLCRSCPRNPL